MKKYRFAAALTAFLIASSSFALTARAANGDYSQIIDSVPIKKYLVMKKGISVPCVTFRYTLAPGQAVAGTDSTHEIMAGPAGALFASSQSTSLTVTFTPDDQPTSEASAPSGSTIQFATTNTSDEVFVEKALTIDLSGVSFPAAGIYRYVVTQQSSTAAGIIPDSTNKRYIDVFVHKSDRTDEDTYDPGSAIIRLNTGVPDADGKSPAAIKSTGFTNRYDTHNLKFTKSVSGNQASGNKYFRFTVKLDGRKASGDEDTRVRVSGTFDSQPTENMATLYDADVMAEANEDVEYVTLSQLREGRDFYIRGGQSILLTGIPAGSQYVVAENNEDYTPSVTVYGDQDCTADDNTVTDTSLTQDTSLDFVNTLNGVIPSTGMAAAFAIPAAAMLAGFAGIALLAVKRVRASKKKALEGNGIE